MIGVEVWVVRLERVGAVVGVTLGLRLVGALLLNITAGMGSIDRVGGHAMGCQCARTVHHHLIRVLLVELIALFGLIVVDVNEGAQHHNTQHTVQSERYLSACPPENAVLY